MLGQSIGASIMLHALKKCPDFEPSIVVLDGAFASYRNLIEHRISSQFGNRAIGYTVAKLFSDSFNAQDAIAAVHSRLVCIHSRADQIIPFDEHVVLFRKATSLQKIFWESATQNHLDTFRNESSPFREQLALYLRELFK